MWHISSALVTIQKQGLPNIFTRTRTYNYLKQRTEVFHFWHFHYLVFHYLSEHWLLTEQVLYVNVAFPILALSSKKRSFSFLKRVFVFERICFKVKVYTEGYFKNLWYRFLEEPMLFLLALR